MSSDVAVSRSSDASASVSRTVRTEWPSFRPASQIGYQSRSAIADASTDEPIRSRAGRGRTAGRAPVGPGHRARPSATSSSATDSSNSSTSQPLDQIAVGAAERAAGERCGRPAGHFVCRGDGISLDISARAWSAGANGRGTRDAPMPLRPGRACPDRRDAPWVGDLRTRFRPLRRRSLRYGCERARRPESPRPCRHRSCRSGRTPTIASTTALDISVVDHRLDLHLGKEVDLVLGAPVGLGVTALATEPADLGDGHADHADLLERRS